MSPDPQREPIPLPAAKWARLPRASAAGVLLFVEALVLAIAIHWARPEVVFALGPPAGVLGAAACELVNRARRGPGASEEPWRLDAWALLVGGFALPAVGFSVGPEAAPLSWLYVATLAAVGAVAIGATRR